MRAFLVALLLCLLMPEAASARYSPMADRQFGDYWPSAYREAGYQPRKRVAHHRHAHRRAARRHRSRPVPLPRPRPGYVMRHIGGATPSRFIRGRLVCARNVNAALAARGVRGSGSNFAKSFLRWGVASGPVPGAVAVFNRRGGGHAAIVHSIAPNGAVIFLNPSSRRQQWVIGPYRGRPIAYRIAA